MKSYYICGSSQRAMIFRILRRINDYIKSNPMLNAIATRLRRVFYWAFGLHIVYIILLIWMPVYTTPLVVTRWFQHIGTGKPIYKTWVPLDKISDKMKIAVIASEDQLFNEHFGFDIESIEKAIVSNKKKGRTKRGASTISQQVAKNVFLWNGRSWLRKGLEVYFTFMIELFWGKERILEVYLNVAETGDGLFGAEAAAKTYFGKTSSKLNANESALIAAVLPNPIIYKVNAPSAHVRKRQRWILNQMRYQTLSFE